MFCRSAVQVAACCLSLAAISFEQAEVPRPSYEEALAAFQGGRLQQAEQMLRSALALKPGDTRALGLMGIILDAQKRYEDAEHYYRQAIRLAPRSASLLNNLGNHYLARGDSRKAREEYLKVVAIEPAHVNANLHLAQMSVEEKRGDAALEYLGRLSRDERASPAVELLSLQAFALTGNRAQTAALLQRIQRQRSSDPQLLASYGHAMLEAEQYPLARELLERAVAAGSTSSESRLDLAIAAFHTSGPDAGLTELDKIPAQKRSGDYFLLRAQILDAMGKFQEAVEALNRSFSAAPTRPDLYFQAALFLIKHQRYTEALDLVRQADKLVPDAPELLLTEAVTLELLRRPDESQALLTRLESRWPQWSQPYLVNGIMLEIRLNSAEAKPLLERAIALGARDAVAYYYLASAITHAAPENTDGAQKAIKQALKLNPNDAYVQSLAGKIAYARKDYTAALDHLSAAIRLWPDMVEARQALSATYRALGEKEKSISELKEIVRIKQANRTADQAPPFPVGNLLFTVRPPNYRSTGIRH